MQRDPSDPVAVGSPCEPVAQTSEQTTTAIAESSGGTSSSAAGERPAGGSSSSSSISGRSISNGSRGLQQLVTVQATLATPALDEDGKEAGACASSCRSREQACGGGAAVASACGGHGGNDMSHGGTASGADNAGSDNSSPVRRAPPSLHGSRMSELCDDIDAIPDESVCSRDVGVATGSRAMPEVLIWDALPNQSPSTPSAAADGDGGEPFPDSDEEGPDDCEPPPDDECGLVHAQLRPAKAPRAPYAIQHLDGSRGGVHSLPVGGSITPRCRLEEGSSEVANASNEIRLGESLNLEGAVGQAIPGGPPKARMGRVLRGSPGAVGCSPSEVFNDARQLARGCASSLGGADFERALQEKNGGNDALRYHPPPEGDDRKRAVDVIEHGSEVLIIRREP